MFCYQCEQTEHGTGCTTVGVCGKTAPVSKLQDLLWAGNKGKQSTDPGLLLLALSLYMHELTKLGKPIKEIGEFLMYSSFSTLTNVNFDDARFMEMLRQQVGYIQQAKTAYEAAAKAAGQTPKTFADNQYGNWKLASTTDAAACIAQADAFGVQPRQAKMGIDYVGLQELIHYGIKGMSAYADHCHNLGYQDPEVVGFFYEAMAFLTREDCTVPELLAFALKVGEVNLKVMAELEGLHISKFGSPTPKKVRASGVEGKAILISGHDLGDLEALLKQTEGTGVNVYTHGEMLPGHGYPQFQKYKHFAGHFGGAWQNQKFDFAMFPGPIVMTSNCIIEPMKSYKSRIYTRASVGWPGVKHLATTDFSAVIKQAQSLDGFEEDEPERYLTTGFGKDTVLSVAPQVIEGVKSGAIKHFFLIGGCDGAEGERSYFTDIAKLTPKDSVILTLACGKYRFNDLEFGDIGGIPRMLDMGQCNDAYGAIQVAVALANAFKTDVNSLPLSFVVSWFEQKAVAVLLTLLHLGIKRIYLGPNLPAFCTPTMLEVLTSTFELRQIHNAQEDIKVMLARE